MKFIVDQQLPPALAKWLEARGHSAEHVFFIGLGDVDDVAIWDYAEREAAVVVTKDMDFAERRLRDTSGPTILWLRIGNSTKKELLEIMDRAWPVVEPALSHEPIVEVR
jgi:predicted nuclease of predicted toxin-antitoxin system